MAVSRRRDAKEPAAEREARAHAARAHGHDRVDRVVVERAHISIALGEIGK